MREICEHDTFRNICNICHRDGLLKKKDKEITRLRAALLHTLASLEAAISLLEHGGKAAKKAAPSDKMFDQMLKDYRAQADKARAAEGKSRHDR